MHDLPTDSVPDGTMDMHSYYRLLQVQERQMKSDLKVPGHRRSRKELLGIQDRIHSGTRCSNEGL